VTTSPVREAVVLSGGAVYASYEVGVLKWLFVGDRQPIRPDIFTGTSAGAFNAAALVATLEKDYGRAIEFLETLWLNVIADTGGCGHNGIYRIRADVARLLNPSCLMAPVSILRDFANDTGYFAREVVERGLDFTRSSGRLQERLLGFIDISAAIDGSPLEQTIRENLRFDRILQSDFVLKVITTNWKLGQVEIFSNIDLNEEIGPRMVLASTAVPGVFPPADVNGDPHVDGGVLMNTPLKPAIESGADVIHVISLDPAPERIPMPPLPNTVSIFDRMSRIQHAVSLESDMESAERVNRLLALSRNSEPGARGISTASTELLSQVEGPKQHPARPLTIHHYHPTDPLGGSFGLLSVDRDSIQHLIDLGYRDASRHNCAESRCVLPETPRAAPRRPGDA
jgi:NTE family protein